MLITSSIMAHKIHLVNTTQWKIFISACNNVNPCISCTISILHHGLLGKTWTSIHLITCQQDGFSRLMLNFSNCRVLSLWWLLCFCLHTPFVPYYEVVLRLMKVKEDTIKPELQATTKVKNTGRKWRPMPESHTLQNKR